MIISILGIISAIATPVGVVAAAVAAVFGAYHSFQANQNTAHLRPPAP